MDLLKVTRRFCSNQINKHNMVAMSATTASRAGSQKLCSMHETPKKKGAMHKVLSFVHVVLPFILIRIS